jgi:hypothetical protein
MLLAVALLVTVSLQIQTAGEQRLVLASSPEVDAIERRALNVVDPKEQQLTPPDRWAGLHGAEPDPWVLDSGDFATDFKAQPGELSEFFSEDPKHFAHTDTWDGASWEWPYVPDGQDARGMRSGYDWEGAMSSASVRGLDMPPDHDVFGELGPFPALSGQDELFPGVKSWDVVMPAGALPGSMTMGIPFEQPRAAQSLAQLSAGQQQMARLQSLQNLWTEYTQEGSPVKCVCDAAAAGDPEMEGIDPNVKPACTCTGGRLTKFSKTEEGGPLDTGGHGAWPQELPGASRGSKGDGAAYIDGIVGNNAYKAQTQTLAAAQTHEDEVVAAWKRVLRAAAKAGGVQAFSDKGHDQRSSLQKMHEDRAGTATLAGEPVASEPVAEATDEPVAEATDDEPVAEATDEPVAEATDEPVAEATDEAVAEATDEPVADETDEPVAEETDEATGDKEIAQDERPPWQRMHEDPAATPTDRNIIEQVRRNYRIFKRDSGLCDEYGPVCADRCSLFPSLCHSSPYF